MSFSEKPQMQLFKSLKSFQELVTFTGMAPTVLQEINLYSFPVDVQLLI